MFLTTSRNRIVQMPENMMARLGSRPITIGNTNVAPNIATTCWAPTPTVLPHGSRWRGPTASPGWGLTTSHLNIDMTKHPSACVTGPEWSQTSDPHDTPTTATIAEGTPFALAPLVGAFCSSGPQRRGCGRHAVGPPRTSYELVARAACEVWGHR